MQQSYQKGDRQEKEEITLDDKVYIDDAIACITSTAVQMASFTFWTSACTNKHQSNKNCLRHNVTPMRSLEVAKKKKRKDTYPCPTNHWKAESTSPQSFDGP